ncbi:MULTISPECIES: cell filamentation protein Fic [unclassified Pseudofrankia]|uniref:cell filamentation protein Fic n=1 Tax=unclassified Pseudofrankia TaxID=2994372 RepID=UPI0008DB119C|nr:MULTISPECIES: cell filamentation protein Fic [unclassified Pseudofrankia]MDT3443083.1 cell filamentation protein Fic [Pseudofrankia sp. BMG5.37]OHV49947.1 cell filamentation protein Fic [Pseudofrankia sp. BMG5.36]
MPTSKAMLGALGFTWDRSAVRRDIPRFSVERAIWRFQRSLPEYVWDAAVLEGNPFTYPEVQTLLDGITVGGRKISDERQVLNLAEAAGELAQLVKTHEFRLSKKVSDRLQLLLARDEALESGHFRGEGKETLTPGVSLGEFGRYFPPATERGGQNLRRIHSQGLEFLTADVDEEFEQAIAYFLFGSLQQFYYDGNKRTARYMMNGHLMSQGMDAISVPAARRHEFNAEMVDFFRHKDGTGMFGFLTSCRLAADDGVLPPSGS